MSKEYIEQRDGGYYIAGKRISLDSVVYAFRRGAAPESILRSFPLLTLEEIYGAITYYLAHQREVDAYLEQEDSKEAPLFKPVKVRFQADADFNEDIITGVLRRVPEIDFQTAPEANLEGMSDREVLALCA